MGQQNFPGNNHKQCFSLEKPLQGSRLISNGNLVEELNGVFTEDYEFEKTDEKKNQHTLDLSEFQDFEARIKTKYVLSKSSSTSLNFLLDII